MSILSEFIKEFDYLTEPLDVEINQVVWEERLRSIYFPKKEHLTSKDSSDTLNN